MRTVTSSCHLGRPRDLRCSVLPLRNGADPPWARGCSGGGAGATSPLPAHSGHPGLRPSIPLSQQQLLILRAAWEGGVSSPHPLSEEETARGHTVDWAPPGFWPPFPTYLPRQAWAYMGGCGWPGVLWSGPWPGLALLHRLIFPLPTGWWSTRWTFRTSTCRPSAPCVS